MLFEIGYYKKTGLLYCSYYLFSGNFLQTYVLDNNVFGTKKKTIINIFFCFFFPTGGFDRFFSQYPDFCLKTKSLPASNPLSVLDSSYTSCGTPQHDQVTGNFVSISMRAAGSPALCNVKGPPDILPCTVFRFDKKHSARSRGGVM